MFDFGAPAPAPAPAVADDEEEWAFSSALPESNGLPSSNHITVADSTLLIELHATRKSPSDTAITMTVQFSSKAVQPISELTFQVAVTRVSSPST
jgi:ADP-ribosylation factor-binding protein GGA